MTRLRLVILTLVTWTAFFVCIPPISAAAPQTATMGITVNGLPLAADVPPLVKNNRTYLPFRALAEAIGVTVSWNADIRTVHASDGNTVVELTIGQQTAWRNGATVALDAPPLAVAGRTLVPLRFFAESFGATVQWDPVAHCVHVISPPAPLPIIGFYALGDSRTSSWVDLFGTPYPNTGTGHTDLVGELALGWYSLDDTGNLLTESSTGWQRPEGWENVLQAAERYRLRTEMVVHLTDTDGRLSQLLSDAEAVQRAVEAIAAEAGSYQGVNLDFEGLGWREDGAQLEATKAQFTSFAGCLAQRLTPLGRGLTLTLHAPNSAYRGYDYQALGQIADRIIVMAYDYGARPEPMNQVNDAVEMAITRVPAAKLWLGVSVPSETPTSILPKIALAKRYHLGGIALWRLGLLPSEMWSTLEASITPRWVS